MTQYELRALPVGSYVQTVDGWGYEKQAPDLWCNIEGDCATDYALAVRGVREALTRVPAATLEVVAEGAFS